MRSQLRIDLRGRLYLGRLFHRKENRRRRHRLGNVREGKLETVVHVPAKHGWFERLGVEQKRLSGEGRTTTKQTSLRGIRR